MTRTIAAGSQWWVRLFLLAVAAGLLLKIPWWIGLPVCTALLALASVRAPWNRHVLPVEVDAPVRGRWVAINSPATKVPSHGTRLYGQTYAIDILHPRPEGVPYGFGWGLGMRRPEEFSTFGEPVCAVADGTVIRTVDRSRDHRSRESYWALAYLFVVEAIVRLLGGARFVAGNHVVVDHEDGVFSVYCHLQRGSVAVRVGQRVETGEQLGMVGNSGNTTEPHLHFQFVDDARLQAAAGMPFRWRDVTFTGEQDQSWSKKPVSTDVVAGLPADGQVFETAIVRQDRVTPAP